MKKLHLLLVVIGLIVPNNFVLQESINCGNILLWMHPAAAISGMVATLVSTA